MYNSGETEGLLPIEVGEGKLRSYERTCVSRERGRRQAPTEQLTKGRG